MGKEERLKIEEELIGQIEAAKLNIIKVNKEINERVNA